ncbi:MAG: hypothetical protein ABFS35_21190 [Bacteroidota bacterium]
MKQLKIISSIFLLIVLLGNTILAQEKMYSTKFEKETKAFHRP